MNDDKLRSLFASLATLTQQGPIPGELFKKIRNRSLYVESGKCACSRLDPVI